MNPEYKALALEAHSYGPPLRLLGIGDAQSDRARLQGSCCRVVVVSKVRFRLGHGFGETDQVAFGETQRVLETLSAMDFGTSVFPLSSVREYATLAAKTKAKSTAIVLLVNIQ
jgi:hypothetical protein